MQKYRQKVRYFEEVQSPRNSDFRSAYLYDIRVYRDFLL